MTEQDQLKYVKQVLALNLNAARAVTLEVSLQLRGKNPVPLNVVIPHQQAELISSAIVEMAKQLGVQPHA